MALIFFIVVLGVASTMLVILFWQDFNTLKPVRWTRIAGLSIIGIFVIIFLMGIGSKVVIIMGSLIAIGCLFGASRNLNLKRITDDLPTSKTQGVFIGLTKLKGTAESEIPMSSYLAGVACVQYSWQIDEHWSKTVTYTDSKGNRRTRKESGWKTLGKGGYSPPFYLKDDTGVIRIMPESATVQGVVAFDKTFGPNDDIYFGKGPQKEITNTDHRRRFYETVIPHHTILYVTGQARERQDAVAAEIAYDKESPMFLISLRSEKQISSSYNRWFWFWAFLGLFVAIGSAAVWNASRAFGLRPGGNSYIVAIAVYLVVLLISWIWTVYNSLINLRNSVQRAWSQIDIQLKRRYDLIPNLIKVVTGYRDYENQLQALIAKLRAQAVAIVSDGTNSELKGLAPSLRAAIEQYPDLKANEPFLRLQNSLVETEERIALARDYFNSCTTFYNTRLEIIPDRYVGNLAKLGPRSLLRTMDIERALVQVNLVTGQVAPAAPTSSADIWKGQEEEQTAQPETIEKRYCRNCGGQVAQGAVFCSGCGVQIPTGKKFCQNCGQATDPEAEFCVKCGAQLGSKVDAETIP